MGERTPGTHPWATVWPLVIAVSRSHWCQAIGATQVRPAEVTTDQAPVYPGVLEELLPAAWHCTDRYANRIERDHGRLKARLRPIAPPVASGAPARPNGANPASPRPIPPDAVGVELLLRVAFWGRTSTEDHQDPTLSLPRPAHCCPRRAATRSGHHRPLLRRGIRPPRPRHPRAVHRAQAAGHPDPPRRRHPRPARRGRRPDRRFDAVICESIDRISRRTYDGAKIEHELDQAGVLLFAADEPIILTGKRATALLTRRLKQGVAEWYVLELVEKSRAALEEHTRQGFNTCRPPTATAPNASPTRSRPSAPRARPKPGCSSTPTAPRWWPRSSGCAWLNSSGRARLPAASTPTPTATHPPSAALGTPPRSSGCSATRNTPGT
jgi:Resolvase, N terminal domain